MWLLYLYKKEQIRVRNLKKIGRTPKDLRRSIIYPQIMHLCMHYSPVASGEAQSNARKNQLG
jgi:hypothetical protein